MMFFSYFVQKIFGGLVVLHQFHLNFPLFFVFLLKIKSLLLTSTNYLFEVYFLKFLMLSLWLLRLVKTHILLRIFDLSALNLYYFFSLGHLREGVDLALFR